MGKYLGVRLLCISYYYICYYEKYVYLYIKTTGYDGCMLGRITSFPLP